MKQKNKDTLRGFGFNKLDWGSSGRMLSTIKRLTSTFTVSEKTKSPKNPVFCPVCKKKFNVNNIKRIPTHYERYYFLNSSRITCKGSWSVQPSENFVTTTIEKCSTSIGSINVGDNLLIDFSRAVWKEIANKDGLIEDKISRIELVKRLDNAGDLYSFTHLIYFENLDKAVRNNSALFNQCINLTKK